MASQHRRRHLGLDAAAGLTIALLGAKFVGVFAAWQWQLIPYAVFVIAFGWHVVHEMTTERADEADSGERAC